MERDYIAFISYQHNAVDEETAITIQKYIEHFRIPRKLRSRRDQNRKDPLSEKGSPAPTHSVNQKHLGYVFRDNDELKVSADLSESLYQALDHSEYLIVLCSPDYKKSVWCNREIEYFIKHHSIEKVIPVLVSGKVQESFPESLIRIHEVQGESVLVEPLAANVVAEDSKTRKKLIKKEILRIIAQLLNCDYDELVERKKKYERKRMMAGSGVVMAAMAVFISMLLIKNSEINEKYMESLRSQARYMTRISVDQMAKGDKEKALLAALALQPSDKTDEPLVYEQNYALSHALHIYEEGYLAEHFIQMPQGSTVRCSEDNHYLYVILNDQVSVYDTGKGEVIWTLDGKMIKNEFPVIQNALQDEEISRYRSVKAKGNKELVLIYNQTVMVLDIEERTCSSCFTLDGSISSISASAMQDQKIILCGNGRLQMYDLCSGELFYQKDFNENLKEIPIEYSINAVDFSEDGSRIGIAFEYDYLTPEEIERGSAYGKYSWQDILEEHEKEKEYFDQYPPMGLITLCPDTGEITVYSHQYSHDVFFLEDAIGTSHSQFPERKLETLPYLANQMVTYQPCIYRLDGASAFFVGEKTTDITANFCIMKREKIWDRDLMICSLNSKLYVIDSENADMVAEYTFRADVTGVVSANENLYVVLTNGYVSRIVVSGTQNVNCYETRFTNFIERAYGTDEFLILKTNDGVILCPNKDWEGFTDVSLSEEIPEELTISAIKYVFSESKDYRVLELNADYSGMKGLVIYESTSESPALQYISEGEKKLILYTVVSDSGQDYLYAVENRTNSQYYLITGDLSSGEVVSEKQIPYSDSRIYPVLSSDGRRMYISDFGQVLPFDLTGDEIVPLEAMIPEEPYTIRSENLWLTKDNQYLICLVKDYRTSQVHFYCYDVENKVYKQIEELEDRVTTESTFQVEAGIDSSRILISDKMGSIWIYDCQEGRCIRKLSIDSGARAVFFNQDQYVLAETKDKILLYEIASGMAVSQTNKTEREMISSNQLLTDRSRQYFVVECPGYYSTLYDGGAYYNTDRILYYVSEDFQICMVADIGYRTISTAMGEVSNRGQRYFIYDHFYSFRELKEMADEILQGRTLSEEEKAQYFIAE